MTTFPDMPVLQGDPRTGRYILKEPYAWACGSCSGVVDAGFTTDGASIPRFLWRIAGNPYEVPRIAVAVVHDYLYAERSVSRSAADGVFRDLLIALGFSPFRARAEWLALRSFGWFAWASGTTIP